MASLKAVKVVKEFPPPTKDQPVVRALDGIDFEMSGKSFVSMVGPSGCGKSTFLNIVSGVETPSSGTIEVKADDGGRAKLGYVFQEARLLPVADGARQPHLRPAEGEQDKSSTSSRTSTSSGLRGFEQMYPAHLSGGMQQRVGIARAFSVEPDLLLMDEPFSHLDAITARTMREELQDIWEKKKRTVLFVTHDVLEAVQLSDRIIILEYGGRNFADIPVDLPYPRLQTDTAVSTMQSEILAVFEEMESRRAELDPRIVEAAESAS